MKNERLLTTDMLPTGLDWLRAYGPGLFLGAGEMIFWGLFFDYRFPSETVPFLLVYCPIMFGNIAGAALLFAADRVRKEDLVAEPDSLLPQSDDPPRVAQ